MIWVIMDAWVIFVGWSILGIDGSGFFGTPGLGMDFGRFVIA
jgi:hypothetical protein